MRRRWIVALLAVLLVASTTFTYPTTVPEAAAAPDGMEVGVNYHGVWKTYSDDARAQVLDSLVEAGVDWVRLDVSWAMFQPNGPNSYDMAWGVPRIDKRIAEITARGIKVNLLVYWAPAWSSGTSSKSGRPRNPQDFAKFAAWVAKRYDGSTVSAGLKIDALELWNEPDLSAFWSQTPADTAVSSFAELIRAAGPAAKAANPALTVLAGGPSSVNLDWYRKFYATPGVIGSYDGLVVHPYQSPGNAAPEDFNAKYAQYFMSYLPALSQLMDERGDPARIWATEFGWTAYQAPPGTAAWALGVTQEQQAAYLLRGLARIALPARVQAAFWYTDWDTQLNNPQQDNFGLLKVDYQRKPSWYAMRCANTGQCDYLLSGSPWRFDVSGSEPADSWKDATFNDSTWLLGATPAGYGSGDEATVLPSGSGPTTVYARTTFAAGNDPSNSASVTLRMQVDDGAVVYLNGQEVVRHNMPADPITSGTLAVSQVEGAAQWQAFDVPLTALRPGINLLAVEVHQWDPAPDDLRFDASLNGVAEVTSATVPAAPTGITSAAVPGSVQVSWTAPTADGGAPVTGYTVQATPGGATCSTTGATSCAVADLDPGTQYVFTVRASNAAGSGPASATSAAVNPRAGQKKTPPPVVGGRGSWATADNPYGNG